VSDDIYPSLIGISYPVVRSPLFSTIVQTSQSGREVRTANYQFPLYKWEIPYDFLSWIDARSSLQTLLGFYNAHGGQFDTFLFQDPYDGSAVDTEIGIGDGLATQFQIGRTLGGFFEPVFDVQAITNIKIDGVVTTAYSIDLAGLITFSGAPGNGLVITATFSYYWRVRFGEDSIDFEEFSQNFFEVKKVLLYGVRSGGSLPIGNPLTAKLVIWASLTPNNQDNTLHGSPDCSCTATGGASANTSTGLISADTPLPSNTDFSTLAVTFQLLYSGGTVHVGDPNSGYIPETWHIFDAYVEAQYLNGTVKLRPAQVNPNDNGFSSGQIENASAANDADSSPPVTDGKVERWHFSNLSVPAQLTLSNFTVPV